MKTNEEGVTSMSLDDVISVLGELGRQTNTIEFIPLIMMSIEAHCTTHKIEIHELLDTMSFMTEMDSVIRSKHNIDTLTKDGVDEILGMDEEERQKLLDDVFEDVFGKDNEDD